MSTLGRITSFLRPILCGVGLFMWTGISAASQTDSDTSRLISAGRFAEAREILERSNPTRADILFYNGRVLKAKGRYPEAIDTFRAVLRRAPNHLNARRELAHTLFLTGAFDVAEFHFRELLELDPSDRMQDGYRDFLRSIDRTSPYGASLTATLLPSTNVNRGTVNTVFDTNAGRFVIDRSSRRQSGIGARLGVGGYFRHSLDENSRLIATATIEGTKFKDRLFDSASARAAVSYERLAFQTHFSVTPHLRYTWRHDDSDGHAAGLSLGLRRKLGEAVSAGVSLTREERRFPERDFLEGPYSAATISLSYLFAPDLILRGRLSLDHHRPKASHLRYHGARGSLEVRKSWVGGLNTALSGFYGTRFFENDFPLTDAPRKDKLYGFEASAYHTKIEYQGFAPRLSCSYEKQTSNIALSEFDALGCRMALIRNF